MFQAHLEFFYDYFFFKVSRPVSTEDEFYGVSGIPSSSKSASSSAHSSDNKIINFVWKRRFTVTPGSIIYFFFFGIDT
jgi:hypothetical protein